MRFLSAVICLVSICSFISCTENGVDETKIPLGVFQEAPCPVTLPDGLVEGKDVTCGYVVVPEFHGKPDGGTIKLAIAKVSSLSENPQPDPLIPLPTGPGTSAFDAFLPLMASPIGQLIRSKREAVIFEQRGLYYSEPNLVCEEVHTWFQDRLSQDLQGQGNVQGASEAYKACRESLVAKGVNLEAYKYTESANDLVMVADALGYDKFNALGVSAGTMLAQFLLRNHPNRLRSVVISSVVRIDKSLHASWPSYSASALQHLFELCAADKECNRANPDLGKKLERIVKQFNENPLILEVDDPRSPGAKVPLVINGDRIAEKIFVSSYLTSEVPKVPGLIQAADTGDEEQLAEGFKNLTGPGDRFAWALGYSVFCSESPAIIEEEIVFKGLFPAYEEAVANSAWGPRAIESICEFWGVERMGPEVRELPTTDVPTLLISGEFDSITPEESAAAVAEKLGNAFHYTIPGAAHSAIESSECPIFMTLQFLDDPTKEPDASCISELVMKF